MSTLPEVHPFNRHVRRGMSRVWNEDVIPVLEWESAEQRVVLPQELQERCSIPAPVLRFSTAKRNKMLAERPRFARHVEELESYFATYQLAGAMPAPSNDVAVLFKEETRSYVIVIGPDRNGSWNVASVPPLRPKQREALVNADWMEPREKK